MRSTEGYAGQLLRFATGGKPFRLGIVAEDADGVVHGLTARHVLDASAGTEIVDARTGGLVGVRSTPHPTTPAGAPYETIEAFRLVDQAASYERALHPDYRYHILDPVSAIGKRVKKDAYRGAEYDAGIAITVGRSFEFKPMETSETRLVFDIVEIVFDDGVKNIVKSGDAGALITDMHGGALGLILAKDHEYCYASSLLPYLVNKKLSLVPRSVEKSSPLTSETIARKLSRNIDFVVEGLRQMNSELIGK